MMPASDKICGPIDGRLRCDDEGWFPRPKARRRKTATPFTLSSGNLAPLPRGQDRPDVKCGGRQPMRDFTGPSFKPRERSRVGDERSNSHGQITVAPSSVWWEGRNGAVAIDEVCVTQSPCPAHANSPAEAPFPPCGQWARTLKMRRFVQRAAAVPFLSDGLRQRRRVQRSNQRHFRPAADNGQLADAIRPSLPNRFASALSPAAKSGRSRLPGISR